MNVSASFFWCVHSIESNVIGIIIGIGTFKYVTHLENVISKILNLIENLKCREMCRHLAKAINI